MALKPTSISEIKKIVATCLAGFAEVKAAFLFGSYARGRQNEHSDIDIAVLGSGINTLRLSSRLSEALSSPVDVVTLDSVGFLLMRTIVQQGKLVYCSDRPALACWLSRAYSQIETDSPLFRRMHEGYLRRVAAKGILHDA